MNHCNFTINKNKLLKELNLIAKVIGRKSKQTKNIVAELTITDNLLTIVLPGIKETIECFTFSSAKATLRFYYFKDLIDKGEYKVDSDKIANAMVREAMRDELAKDPGVVFR